MVCSRFNGSDEENLAFVERVNRSGEIFITHTRLADRIVLRLAVGYLHTSEDDVAFAWSILSDRRSTYHSTNSRLATRRCHSPAT